MSAPGTVDRYRVVPAAYVVLLRTGDDGVDSALLQLRAGTGFMDGHWACGAAGHVEAGESVLAAAVREAREELGVRVGEGDLLPLTAMHRTQRTGLAVDERVDFFFACRRWAGEPLLQEAKAADLRWVRLDDLDSLAEPVVPHERHVLTALSVGAVPAVTTFGFPQG
ncbi:NUDIX domain-containing protein [Georgenia sp. H159]|uniref:NUDIX domain-containing protein n=1 Tax=Georgenia sp. H159 TaxID=3076115 RepID=UPI002D76B4CC|nr:NUDIX domain-containing protein [Georgenia sp. H159]